VIVLATSTYNLIASQVVGSGGASTITFSSIPQTYTDLLILESTRDSTGGGATNTVTFNGSGSGYTNRELFANGGSPSSTTNSVAYFDLSVGATATANIFSSGSLYIPNYTSSNYKSFSGEGSAENNSTTAYLTIDANLWSNTAAITSITITCGQGNFVQYSSFYLYGIKNS